MIAKLTVIGGQPSTADPMNLPIYLGPLGAVAVWRHAGGGDPIAVPALIDGDKTAFSGAKFDGNSYQFVRITQIPANLYVHSVTVTAARGATRTTPSALSFDGTQIASDIVSVYGADDIESRVWQVGANTKPDGTSMISAGSASGTGRFLFYEIHLVGHAI